MRRIKPALPEKPKPSKPPLPFKSAPAQTFLPPWQTGKAEPVLAVAAPELSDRFEPGELYDFSYLQPKTKAVRELFVAEYLKDFNGSAALLRLGVNYTQPTVVANRWLKEPYTQFLLSKVIDEVKEDSLVTRNRVIASLIREANNHGLDCSGASRVSALGKLTKILGMEIDKSEIDVRVQGGIMLVPLANNAADWELNAAEAQLTLKNGANQ